MSDKIIILNKKGNLVLDSKKLSFLLKKKGISTERLVELLKEYDVDIGTDMISKYRSKASISNPAMKTISAFAAILDVSEQELFLNADIQKQKITKEELKSNIAKYAKQLPANLLPETVAKIPLIDGRVGAGSYGVVESAVATDELFVNSKYIDRRYIKKPLSAIEVIGDSMSPYVNDGDVVIFYRFENGESAGNIEGKYIINFGGELQVKNLSFDLNGDIIISSENPSYQNKVAKSGSQYDFSIIGRVVGRFVRG